MAFQRKVGEVHARIDIPVHLVMRGACALIRRICERGSRCQPVGRAAGRDMPLRRGCHQTAVEMMRHAYWCRTTVRAR